MREEKSIPRRNQQGNCAKHQESYHCSNQKSTSRCFNAVRTGLILTTDSPEFFRGAFCIL